MPAKGAPAGGQILFMETIWQARSEPHQTYRIHNPPFYLFLSPSSFPSNSPSAHFFSSLLASQHPSPFQHFIFSTSLNFLLFLSRSKISYSLMHGSCREQCYFIFPWQRSLCFSRSHFSFGSNVLLCQR